MKSLKVSPLAKQDISDIWDYTLMQWGEAQAVTYIRTLQDSAQALADEIAIGRATSIRDGYFKLRAGEHFIFYRQSKTEITIIRILHKRMDVGRHL